jgi:endo-1,4-beta-xylanase
MENGVSYIHQSRRPRPRWCVAALATVLPLGLAVPAAVSARAASAGCSVTYTANTWSTGFTASVHVTNLGDPVSTWRLGFTFPGNQQLTSGWSGTWSQTGSAVTAVNADWNGTLGAGASTDAGFQASYTGSNVDPTAFTLNGVACTGAPVSTPPSSPPPSSPPPSSTAPPTTAPPTSTPPSSTPRLPASFRWSSSAALIGPHLPSNLGILAVKDPSVVQSNGRFHVFFSTIDGTNYNLGYTSFTDWSQAATATQTYLGSTAIGSGYRAAPEVFFFAPQQKWYLVYQTGNASYSTNSDINNPAGWSAPKNFYSGTPATITRNIGSGFWVDMWVACDSVNCYLFSSDDNGHLYRSQTTVANFPNGFSEPVIALQDSNRFNLFEASNVYKVAGTNQYVLIVEAIGANGRFFRSWTSTSLAGAWTPLAASESNPFAGLADVTFPGGGWTRDISHGEAIRTNVDQTLSIDPCHLQYLYQGRDPNSSGDYNHLPWRLGLLSLTNPAC